MGNYHEWGDETFDWKGLDEASDYIAKYCKRWGRLGFSTLKEKYGTLRATPMWGTSPHSLIWPGYVYKKYPFQWMWVLDVRLQVGKCKAWNAIAKLIIKWQHRVYGKAYRKAMYWWPHLKEEIVVDADYPELIGEEAQKIHDKYWTDVTTITEAANEEV